jgi:hypothetical protein
MRLETVFLAVAQAKALLSVLGIAMRFGGMAAPLSMENFSLMSWPEGRLLALLMRPVT